MFADKNVKLKVIGGSQILGKDFMKFISGWEKLFQSNGLPAVTSLYEAAAEMQTSLAMRNAVQFYNSEMKTYLDLHPSGIDEETLAKKHLECTQEAFLSFKNAKKLGGKDNESRYEEELQKCIKPVIKIFRAMNESNLKAEKQRSDLQYQHQLLQNEVAESMQKLKEVEAHNVEEIAKLNSVINSAQEQSKNLNEQLATLKEDHDASIQAERTKNDNLQQKMMLETNAKLTEIIEKTTADKENISKVLQSMERSNELHKQELRMMHVELKKPRCIIS